jgi:hypothetical protein
METRLKVIAIDIDMDGNCGASIVIETCTALDQSALAF